MNFNSLFQNQKSQEKFLSLNHFIHYKAYDYELLDGKIGFFSFQRKSMRMFLRWPLLES